jgi:acetyl-CoA C-acetyltransferase
MGSIKGKVAIIGAGCTKFGELYDKNYDDLVIEATDEALKDAGVEMEQIEAFWAGYAVTGTLGGVTISYPLKIQYKPVGRTEHACSTGTEAVRSACYGVASGAFDLVMVVGFEKLKDTGASGISSVIKHGDVIGGEMPVSAPGLFALAAVRYFHHYGLSPQEGKEMLAKISVKSHANGALNPKSHFQKKVTLEQVINAPIIAWPLGLFDCCGVSEGAAAVILTRSDLAKNYRTDPVFVDAIQNITGPCDGYLRDDYDYVHFEGDVRFAQALFKEAEIKNPRKELSAIQMHDCFSIAEAISLEDFGVSPRGQIKKDIDAGVFNLHGELPVNTDGGLKCFGHPVGASGVRQMYEAYVQLQGKAQKPERQLKNPKKIMTHTRGGWPGYNLPIGSILSR